MIMKGSRLYFVLVLALMFITVGFSDSLVLTTYQLPITNIHNYNNISKAVAFVYIPSSGAAMEYKCTFSINCGRMPFGVTASRDFDIYSNTVEPINITITNVTKPLLCLESVVCTSKENPNNILEVRKKIVLYPFFETFPGQLEVQMITPGIWYLKKENYVYLVDNYSTAADCVVDINLQEEHVHLKPGSVVGIPVKNPDYFNVVILKCNGGGIKYENFTTTKGITFHKIVDLSNYLKINIEQTTDGFNINLKNNYNQNVVCFVSVYNSQLSKKYIEIKNIVPPTKDSMTTWSYKLSDLGIPIQNNVNIVVTVDCKAPYTTEVNVKKELNYVFSKDCIDISKLKNEFYSNLSEIMKLYIEIYYNVSDLENWQCGNYESLLSSIKSKVYAFMSSYVKDYNNENALKELVSEEYKYIQQLKKTEESIYEKVKTIKEKYNTYRQEFLERYNYVSNLYYKLSQRGCISDSERDSFNQIKLDYNTILNTMNPSCTLLDKLPDILKQLHSLNQTLEQTSENCRNNWNSNTNNNINTNSKKDVLKKLNELYNELYNFRNQVNFAYSNSLALLVLRVSVLNDVTSLMVNCYNTINSEESTLDMEMAYEGMKSAFNNIYKSFREEISIETIEKLKTIGEYIKTYNINNKQLLNTYNQVYSRVQQDYTDLMSIINSNQDIIKHSKIIKKDLSDAIKEVNKLNKYLTQIEIKVNDTNGNPIPLARVYINGKFVGLTNGNGILTIEILKVPVTITVVAPGYKKFSKEIDIRTNNQYITITLKYNSITEYPPIVEHYVKSNVIFATICSTLQHPSCYGEAKMGLVQIHPTSKQIEQIVSQIPSSYIIDCKEKGNCIPLLEIVTSVVNHVMHYDGHCVGKHGTITYGSKCMAWWGSDYGILTYRTGVCADFARLTVTILRALDIPARYVVIDGQPTKKAEKAYGNSFTHAFTQVYIDGHWVFYDSLWKYIGKPTYPLACVYDVYTPYTTEVNGKYVNTELSLLKQMSKYYKPCSEITSSSTSTKKPALASPGGDYDPSDNYNCMVFLTNKTVICSVNNTEFSMYGLDFNSWMNVTNVYKGFARTLIIGKLNKTMISSYVSPGSIFNILICGLNNSTIVSTGFVAINKTCVLYVSKLPGLFRIRIGYPPFFYSGNILVKRVAQSYGYMVINNSSLAIVTDEPTNFTQIPVLGSINQILATLFIIKEHTCPSGVSVLNNLDIDSINNILLNKPGTMVLINYTDTMEVEHNLLSLCQKPLTFNMITKPSELYPNISKEALDICLLGLDYMNVFV